MDDNLKQRVSPRQERSVHTINLILNTSLALLQEVGFNTFTTKLVAERANIRIRNIYRYFPNKLAIIAALAERMTQKEEAFLDNFSMIANPEIDWETAVRTTIESFAEKSFEDKSLITIRHALHGSPKLLELDRVSNHKIAEMLICALKARGTSLSDELLMVASEIIIDATTVILNKTAYEYYSSKDRNKAEMRITELIRLIISYGSHLFPQTN